MQIEFPILACDVGGTNVRSCLVHAPGSAPLALKPVKTADFPGLAEAMEAVLPGSGPRPATAMVCAAGPVEGRHLQLTNAAWRIDGPEVAGHLGLKQGVLFNDFEAQALSLPALKSDWCRPIGRVAASQGTRLIHGPGTGLGTAALMEVTGRWCPVASEAAHSDFAAVTLEEQRIWPFVEPVHGRITPECLISGPGLRRLHRARLAADGQPRPEADGAAIVQAALTDPDSQEAQTVRMFWRLVARFAGDMALAFLAKGGVTLAGGILPRILPLLDEDAFRSAFEDKAPYAALASRIPVSVLTQPDTVLAGMAAVAASPARYLVDFEGRAWV